MDEFTNKIFQFLFDLCAASSGDGDSALITKEPKKVADLFEEWLKKKNEESENKFIYSDWTRIGENHCMFVREQESIDFVTEEEAKILPSWVDTIKTSWIG
jgi:hypothetical protein